MIRKLKDGNTNLASENVSLESKLIVFSLSLSLSLFFFFFLSFFFLFSFFSSFFLFSFFFFFFLSFFFFFLLTFSFFFLPYFLLSFHFPFPLHIKHQIIKLSTKFLRKSNQTRIRTDNTQSAKRSSRNRTRCFKIRLHNHSLFFRKRENRMERKRDITSHTSGSGSFQSTSITN
jgi:signal transduction histidine kinase